MGDSLFFYQPLPMENGMKRTTPLFLPMERIRTGSCPLPVKANIPKMKGEERKDSAESFFTGGGKDRWADG